MIAVALSDGKRIYGSMNILWIKTAFTVEQYAAKHLADLQDAARAKSLVPSTDRQSSFRQRLWLIASQLGVTGRHADALIGMGKVTL